MIPIIPQNMPLSIPSPKTNFKLATLYSQSTRQVIDEPSMMINMFKLRSALKSTY